VQKDLYQLRYTPRAYVVAETDKMSGRKASDYENMLSDTKVGLAVRLIIYLSDSYLMGFVAEHSPLDFIRSY
jgi:hypothetical protein